jgi:hypothetical protein
LEPGIVVVHSEYAGFPQLPHPIVLRPSLWLLGEAVVVVTFMGGALPFERKWHLFRSSLQVWAASVILRITSA